jgi:hypothetical protein
MLFLCRPILYILLFLPYWWVFGHTKCDVRVASGELAFMSSLQDKYFSGEVHCHQTTHVGCFHIVPFWKGPRMFIHAWCGALRIVAYVRDLAIILEACDLHIMWLIKAIIF